MSLSPESYEAATARRTQQVHSIATTWHSLDSLLSGLQQLQLPSAWALPPLSRSDLNRTSAVFNHHPTNHDKNQPPSARKGKDNTGTPPATSGNKKNEGESWYRAHDVGGSRFGMAKVPLSQQRQRLAEAITAITTARETLSCFVLDCLTAEEREQLRLSNCQEAVTVPQDITDDDLPDDELLVNEPQAHSSRSLQNSAVKKPHSVEKASDHLSEATARTEDHQPVVSPEQPPPPAPRSNSGSRGKRPFPLISPLDESSAGVYMDYEPVTAAVGGENPQYIHQQRHTQRPGEYDYDEPSPSPVNPYTTERQQRWLLPSSVVNHNQQQISSFENRRNQQQHSPTAVLLPPPVDSSNGSVSVLKHPNSANDSRNIAKLHDPTRQDTNQHQATKKSTPIQKKKSLQYQFHESPPALSSEQRLQVVTRTRAASSEEFQEPTMKASTPMTLTTSSKLKSEGSTIGRNSMGPSLNRSSGRSEHGIEARLAALEELLVLTSMGVFGNNSAIPAALVNQYNDAGRNLPLESGTTSSGTAGTTSRRRQFAPPAASEERSPSRPTPKPRLPLATKGLVEEKRNREKEKVVEKEVKVRVADTHKKKEPISDGSAIPSDVLQESQQLSQRPTSTVVAGWPKKEIGVTVNIVGDDRTAPSTTITTSSCPPPGKLDEQHLATSNVSKAFQPMPQFSGVAAPKAPLSPRRAKGESLSVEPSHTLFPSSTTIVSDDMRTAAANTTPATTNAVVHVYGKKRQVDSVTNVMTTVSEPPTVVEQRHSSFSAPKDLLKANETVRVNHVDVPMTTPSITTASSSLLPVSSSPKKEDGDTVTTLPATKETEVKLPSAYTERFQRCDDTIRAVSPDTREVPGTVISAIPPQPSRTLLAAAKPNESSVVPSHEKELCASPSDDDKKSKGNDYRVSREGVGEDVSLDLSPSTSPRQGQRDANGAAALQDKDKDQDELRREWKKIGLALNKWKSSFVVKYGRAPSSGDIQSVAKVKAAYLRYQALDRVLTGVPPSPERKDGSPS